MATTLLDQPKSGYHALPQQINLKGWKSWDDLTERLPKGELHQSASGAWARWTQQHTGESYVQEGVLLLVVERQERLVALTLEEARRATDRGEQTDYWNGWCWLRGGHKPERDVAVAMLADPLPAGRERVLERAPEADQALLRAELERRHAVSPMRPVSELPGNVKKE